MVLLVQVHASLYRTKQKQYEKEFSTSNFTIRCCYVAKLRNKDNRKHIRNSRQNGSLVMAADDIAAEADMKENATAKRDKLEMASIEKAELAKMKPEACNRLGFIDQTGCPYNWTK